MKKFCIYCNKEIIEKLEITDEDGSKRILKINLNMIEIFHEEIGFSYICGECKNV